MTDSSHTQRSAAKGQGRGKKKWERTYLIKSVIMKSWWSEKQRGQVTILEPGTAQPVQRMWHEPSLTRPGLKTLPRDVSGPQQYLWYCLQSRKKLIMGYWESLLPPLSPAVSIERLLLNQGLLVAEERPYLDFNLVNKDCLRGEKVYLSSQLTSVGILSEWFGPLANYCQKNQSPQSLWPTFQPEICAVLSPECHQLGAVPWETQGEW